MGARGWKRPVHTLREALASYLQRSGLAQSALADQIGRAWVDILGPEIARRTRLARVIRKGVLTIEVDSSSLLQELDGFRRAEILKGLQDRVKRKHIEDLRFRLGSGF